MATIKDSIDVNVPLSVAYAHWSHFEDFPHFMENVEDVHPIDSSHYHWRAKYAGKEEEWDAEVVDAVPEKKIAWRSTSGHRNDGVVEFEPISSTSTRVKLQMDHEPASVMEKIGSTFRLDKRMVKKDLENFKRYVEQGTSIH